MTEDALVREWAEGVSEHSAVQCNGMMMMMDDQCACVREYICIINVCMRVCMCACVHVCEADARVATYSPAHSNKAGSVGVASE